MGAPEIRPADEHDLPRLTEIYNHYVETTAITFDMEPYTVDGRRTWFSQFGARGRYRLFVAERGGVVDAYAGTTPFRPKRAYETTVEADKASAARSSKRCGGRSRGKICTEPLPVSHCRTTRRFCSTKVSDSGSRESCTK
jgi:L-amino acid N-acyltransferase YncA